MCTTDGGQGEELRIKTFAEKLLFKRRLDDISYMFLELIEKPNRQDLKAFRKNKLPNSFSPPFLQVKF